MHEHAILDSTRSEEFKSCNGVPIKTGTVFSDALWKGNLSYPGEEATHSTALPIYFSPSISQFVSTPTGTFKACTNTCQMRFFLS